MIEIIVIVVLLAVVFFLFLEISKMKNKLKELQSTKQSQSTRYGQIFEEMVPFSKSFPGDPKSFRFIGDPIDGILFGEDAIKFVEIKMADSALNGRQKRIKKMVDEKKVEWVEIRG
jgi:predicted Holliday junction resolvase-like endonuclease